MPSVCRYCGSSELEKDNGQVVCTKCSAVLEEGTIVAEVEFNEGEGASHVIGQFVAADGTSSTHLTGFGGMYYGESRTATLQNGKRHIEELASRLRLSQHFVEIAYNFYKLAVVRRLTRGHRLTHIIAACLYLACRLESTQHMLLDFSDALQADVYALGHAYLYITNKLAINPPAMDPCIYVSRFAHRLELGEKTHEVSITALRLVSRMKKDWIHTGRRPSGLCGAALLIAARIHGFNRSVDDVIRVVKVCQATVMKRLLEFANTESSNLTVEEFNRVDLETEEDPPAYARSKAEQNEASQLGAVDLAKYEADLLAVHKEIERVLNEAEVKRRRFMYRRFGLREDTDFEKLVDECEVELGKGDPASEAASSKATGKAIDDDDNDDDEEELDDAVAFVEGDIDEIMRQEGGAYKLRPTLASLGIATDNEQLPPSQAVLVSPQRNKSDVKQQQNDQEEKEDSEKSQQPEQCELDTSGIDDGEIDGYLLKPAEVKVRTILWSKLNADYLKEMAEKAARLREEEAERAKNPNQADQDAAAKAKATAAKKRRSRKIQPQPTPGHAIEVLVERKKLSSKIDYEKLRSLMPGGSGGVPATPTQQQQQHAPTSSLVIDDEISAKKQRSEKTETDEAKSLLARRFQQSDDEDDDEEDEGDGTGGSHQMSAADMLAQFSGGSYASAAGGGGDDYDS